jgi:hypothetical protein
VPCLLPGFSSPKSRACSKASGPTVASASVGFACASCCAGVRPSSMGGSAAVCAKFSGASAAAAASVASVLAASSLANLRWKAIDHCCLFVRRVEGVKVAMDRGFASRALEGVALMARTAARRRRNLHTAISTALLHGNKSALT